MVAKANAPFLKDPVLALEVGGPLHGGLVSERHQRVHPGQRHAGALFLPDTQTNSTDTVREARADKRQRGTHGSFPESDTQGLWVLTTHRGIRHGPGKIMLFFVALMTRLSWPFLPPSPSLKTGLL